MNCNILSCQPIPATSWRIRRTLSAFVYESGVKLNRMGIYFLATTSIVLLFLPLGLFCIAEWVHLTRGQVAPFMLLFILVGYPLGLLTLGWTTVVLSIRLFRGFNQKVRLHDPIFDVVMIMFADIAVVCLSWQGAGRLISQYWL